METIAKYAEVPPGPVPPATKKFAYGKVMMTQVGYLNCAVIPQEGRKFEEFKLLLFVLLQSFMNHIFYFLANISFCLYCQCNSLYCIHFNDHSHSLFVKNRRLAIESSVV